jgi:hypothetical protein
MLELVYWIGRHPGVTDADDSANNIYRDYRNLHDRRSRPDRWVVIHLHFLEDQGHSGQLFNHDWRNGHTTVQVVSFPVNCRTTI